MPPRIGYVSTYPPTHCGVAEYTRMLVSALKSINPKLTIYILCNADDGCVEGFDREAGASIHPSFIRRSGDYSKLLDILSEINGVDIIHVQHEYGIFGRTTAILDALIEARSEGLVRKIVFTMHTIHHPLSGDRYALEFQRNLNSVDAVIVHSYLQEFEIQHQGVDPLKIHRIPHGTFLNPYLGEPRLKLTNELRLGTRVLSGLTFVVPGFLRRDKGLDILASALEYLGDLRGLNLIVAGELKDPEVLKVIEDVGRRINLVFMEKYLSNEEMLKLISLADVIVLPYRDRLGIYSVSGILHLSMGSLKPIIGTRAPRLIELYQFAPRLTVPPRNPYELSRIIRWIMQNYDYAVAYMAYLYGYAVRTQWLRMARRHLSLYQSLLHQD